MTQKNQERLIALGLFMLLFIVMLPLLMISRYNVMSADDYTYINIAQKRTFRRTGLF